MTTWAKAVQNENTLRLSLCLILQDEGKPLEPSVESVRGIVDEILLVSAGCDGSAPEAAHRLGAKWVSGKGGTHLEDACDRALREASGDWILVLKAGETIPERCRRSIREAIERPVGDAYRLRVAESGPGGSEAKTEPPDLGGRQCIRLFRKVPGIIFRDPDGILLEESGGHLGLRVADLPGVVVVSFRGSGERQVAERSSRPKEQEVVPQSDDVYSLLEMATQRFRQGRNEEAVQVCDRALQRLRQGGERADRKRLLASLWMLKGDALKSLGQYEDAIATYRQCMHEVGVSPALLNNLGAAYESLGRYEEAAHCYREAASQDPIASRPKQNLARVERKLRKERTLSVCMIVRDAARTLPRALESATHFADEIVVVDTGSRDETVEIAKRFGAKLGHFAWCDDFAAARNASLDLATSDWVMWLDADDYVPPTEWPKLQELKYQPLDRAFMFLLKNEGAVFESCWQTRMFPRHPKLRFRFPVHEQISPAVSQLGLQVKTTNVTIVHAGYETKEVVLAKKEKYLRMLVRHLEQHPEDTLSRYHAAFLYHALGRFPEAVAEYQRIVEDHRFEKEYPLAYASAWLYLGRTYLSMGNLDRAEEALRRAQELDPHSQLTLVSLAQVYNAKGDHGRALESLRGLRAESVHPTSHPMDVQALAYAIENERGIAYEGLNDFKRAFKAYLKAQRATWRYDFAVKRASRILNELQGEVWERWFLRLLESGDANCETLFEVGSNLVGGGKPRLALRAFEIAVERDPTYVKAWRALARVKRHLEGTEAAYRVLAQGLQRNPSSETLATDVAELLFELERFQEIIHLGHPAVGPARIAASLLLGDMHRLRQEATAWRALAASSELSTRSLWEAGKFLPEPFRFMMAVACGAVDPRLPEAVEAGVKGWLERRRPDRALTLAERFALHCPQEPLAFELLGACYQMLGVPAAVRMCEERLRELVAGSEPASPAASLVSSTGATPEPR